MRFERIVIRNFRGIREYRLELPAEGVVVIEGENELGKSSIAEALWMVFESPDSSESDRVRVVKPVDRDAGAEIEVLVSTGPYRFDYRKRYHKNHQTILRIETPRREDLTGREAHERVQKMLEETTDRALWEALRLLQGDALTEISVGGNLSIAKALDEAAVTSLGGQREQTLFERIEDEFLHYFTKTGRENKEYTNLRDAVGRLQGEAIRVESRLQELEAMAGRCVELDAAIARLQSEADAARVALAEVEAQVKLREDAVQTVRDRESELSLAEAKLAQLKSLADRRVEAVSDSAALAERIARTQSELNDAQARMGVFENAFAEADRALKAAQAKLEKVSAAVEVAQADYSYMHEQLQVQQMTARLQRVRTAQQSLRELADFLNTCLVNPRTITELEESQNAIAVDRGRLETEGAQVEVAVASPATIRLDGEEQDIGNEAFRFSVAGSSVLHLPGGIEVRVSAGRSVAAIQSRLQEAVEKFAARCKELRVAGLEEARALEARRLEAVNERRHLETQIRADLDDLKTPEDLEAKIERDRQRGVQHLARRQASAPMPASLQEARDLAQTARDAENLAKAEVAPLENAVRAAQNGAVVAREKLRELERRLEVDLETRQKQEEWLAIRRAEQPDETLSQALTHSEQVCSETQAGLEQARSHLDLLPDVTAGRAIHVARSEGTRQQLRAAEDELNRLTGALTHAGESGLHQQRESALIAQVEAEAELDAFSQRAEAAGVLFETMRRHRDTAQRSYALPLQDRLNELGRRVFNQTFAIELDSGLKISRRTLDGVTLDFRQLSGGAKEQMGILMRLACASLVSPSGGVPLILDDVLGWSDPGRIERLGKVLAEAGSGVQVIVLTCTPDRFASVVPSTVISLPSGRVRKVEAGGSSVPTATSAPAPTSRPRPVAPTPLEPGAVRQAGFDLFEAEPASKR